MPAGVWPAGPKEKLDSTAVSQPAIFVASMAALEKLKATEGAVSLGAQSSAQHLRTLDAEPQPCLEPAPLHPNGNKESQDAGLAPSLAQHLMKSSHQALVTIMAPPILCSPHPTPTPGCRQQG